LAAGFELPIGYIHFVYRRGSSHIIPLTHGQRGASAATAALSRMLTHTAAKQKKALGWEGMNNQLRITINNVWLRRKLQNLLPLCHRRFARLYHQRRAAQQ
jgi:2-methylcitrate dehydratase PrpD